MDNPNPTPAFAPAPVVAPVIQPVATETVTLKADSSQTTLPSADADALVAAGLATAPAVQPQAVVLLRDAGGRRAGSVVMASAAVALQLGPGARAATVAEQEIGGPNLHTLTSL